MISKKLLGEVLGIKYSFEIQEYNELSLNNLEWWQNEIYKEQMHTINIYELAHKCKDWAFTNGFGLTSGLLNYSKTKIAVLENIDLLMPKISFTDNTEVEAIIKACQWILDNKEQK